MVLSGCVRLSSTWLGCLRTSSPSDELCHTLLHVAGLWASVLRVLRLVNTLKNLVRSLGATEGPCDTINSIAGIFSVAVVAKSDGELAHAE